MLERVEAIDTIAVVAKRADRKTIAVAVLVLVIESKYTTLRSKNI